MLLAYLTISLSPFPLHAYADYASSSHLSELLKFWHRNVCPISEREVIVEEGIWERTRGLRTKKCLLFPRGLLETARGREKSSRLGI